MDRQHQLAQAKYQALLEKSLDVSQNSLPLELRDDVWLKRIDDASLAQARIWEASMDRSDDATWSWVEGFRRYAYRHPKRFDLAIWYRQSKLCGLSLGKPTFTGGALRLDVIEGAPEHHPLKGKIVTLTVIAARDYAINIGATQVRIMRPVNDSVIRHYQQHGFTLKRGHESNVPTHLWLDI